MWHLACLASVLQDMFLAAVTVLDRLVSVPEHAAQIGLVTSAIKQMEAVAQILLRRVDTESKYLARLEGGTAEYMCMHSCHDETYSRTKIAPLRNCCVKLLCT